MIIAVKKDKDGTRREAPPLNYMEAEIYIAEKPNAQVRHLGEVIPV